MIKLNTTPLIAAAALQNNQHQRSRGRSALKERHQEALEEAALYQTRRFGCPTWIRAVCPRPIGAQYTTWGKHDIGLRCTASVQLHALRVSASNMERRLDCSEGLLCEPFSLRLLPSQLTRAHTAHLYYYCILIVPSVTKKSICSLSTC